MPDKITVVLKARIPVFRQCRYSVASICRLLGVNKTFIYKTIRLARTASIASQNANKGHRGKRRNPSINEIAFLTASLRRNPAMYWTSYSVNYGHVVVPPYLHRHFSAPCTLVSSHNVTFQIQTLTPS
ncbi:hypothetical protein C8R48DRAFT_244377 [Suillus tomentosus]|nr:hypothetical protein C8R48DRAFT_244377 [Suillus tomentosus]